MHFIMKPKAAFFCDWGEERIDYVYARGRRERVADLTELYPHLVCRDNFEEHVGNLGDLEVIFSTWGMPALSRDELAQLPALKLLLYGAGSVKGFAGPFLERGVPIVSAWRINATCVAEYVVAQIVLSCKGFFRNDDSVAPRLILGPIAPFCASNHPVLCYTSSPRYRVRDR